MSTPLSSSGRRDMERSQSTSAQVRAASKRAETYATRPEPDSPWKECSERTVEKLARLAERREMAGPIPQLKIAARLPQVTRHREVVPGVGESLAPHGRVNGEDECRIAGVFRATHELLGEHAVFVHVELKPTVRSRPAGFGDVLQRCRGKRRENRASAHGGRGCDDVAEKDAFTFYSLRK